MIQPRIEIRTDGNGVSRVFQVIEGISCTIKGVEIWKTNSAGVLSGLTLASPVFTGQLTGPDGTAAAPSYSFTSTPTLGLRRFDSAGMAVVVGGTDAICLSSNVGVNSNGSFTWTNSNSNPNATVDLSLWRDAANTLALRNGTNSQVFQIYNTYTSASVYENLFVGWSGNIAALVTTTVGGTARAMYVGTQGAAQLSFRTNNTDRWVVNSSGHLLGNVDNTYDIGATGATRPRNYWGAGTISAGGITPNGSLGAPVTVGGPSGRLVAQTAAQTLATFTVGAADATFDVSANINVTTATAHNFTVTCVYTDETNVSRTLTFGFVQLTGSTFITAITNITGAGPYESPVFHIRAKAATSITIATTGTFTTVTYNGEGYIQQKG